MPGRGGYVAAAESRMLKTRQGSLMIDVTTQINAVFRTVRTRAWKAADARVVTVSQSFPTDAADLWDACTNRDRIHTGSCRSPVSSGSAAAIGWPGTPAAPVHPGVRL
ncbi:hypothetical protein [Mycobacterium sp. OTB74]|uniref:hypothetical protein n=1 Tax=Mycobacterium sp. OTB74 TaxID=1853452 RepID=UPI00247B4DCA|nr:hypothetical protein [Mycobacterium sp. OTB74]